VAEESEFVPSGAGSGCGGLRPWSEGTAYGEKYLNFSFSTVKVQVHFASASIFCEFSNMKTVSFF
jgi:hypothetical protein